MQETAGFLEMGKPIERLSYKLEQNRGFLGRDYLAGI